MWLAALVGVLPGPAMAAWLTCGAGGSDKLGRFAFETTVADVGPLDAGRLAAMRARLHDAVLKSDAAATAVAVDCRGFDTEDAAVSHYTRALELATRAVGWERVTVLAPLAWLPEREIVADPSEP